MISPDEFRSLWEKVMKGQSMTVVPVEPFSYSLIKPKALDGFMYALMKTARRNSLLKLLDQFGVTEEDYEEVSKWFKDNFGITL